MKRGGNLKRRPWGSQKSDAQRERDAERKAREFARKYGSLERVWFVSQVLLCAASGERGDNENAHAVGGGVGRKADYTTVLPLSPDHHRELHRIGAESFEHKYGINLEEAAAATELAWLTSGTDIVARAKADGRYERWLKRRNPVEQDDAA